MTANKIAGNLLVTGVTGSAESAIIREFRCQGIAVNALVRSMAKLTASPSDGQVNYVEGDMAKPEMFSKALYGVERALLLSTANLEMVETQCTFIDACKAAGVRHIVKFSGEEAGIGFDPQKFLFTRMHEEIEDYLENSGLQWTHIRPSQFMEVYLREAASIKNDGVLALALGDITMSPVALADIAKVVVALLAGGGHHGESLRMTGPEALTMTEVAAILTAVTGKRIAYVKVSTEARRAGMLAAGVPKYLADAIAQQTAERLRNPIARVDLHTHELFGIRPTYFREFAQCHASAFGIAA